MADVDEVENTFNDSFVDEPSGDSQTAYESDQSDGEQRKEDPKLADIIEQLKKSGAILKKPIEKHHCFTCDVDFNDIFKFHSHLLSHISLPSIILKKIDDDDDDDDVDEDEEWLSDPEKSSEYNTDSPLTTSQGNIAKIGGITIKSSKTNVPVPFMGIKSVGNLIIKKIPNALDTKEETPDQNYKVESPSDSKSSGTLKLTIKHFSDKKFQVVNGSQVDCKNEELCEETVMASKENEDANESTSELKNTEVNENNMFEEEDSKIPVNEYLNTSIKKEITEANDIGESTCQPSENKLLDAKIKIEEIETHPPASTDSSENQLKVKSFANEQTSKQTQNDSIVIPKPMIIPKIENNVIEINCDSDKEDDEIIFISSSPIPDKKPPIGLTSDTKNIEVSSTTSTTVNSSNMPGVTVNASTEKQHSFNWNAPIPKIKDSWEKLLADKSSDSMLENILSSHRKDGISDLGSSEYISLDKLGPQHTCDICNTKFTSLSALDAHKISTGHSNQLAIPTSASNALNPYQSSGFSINDLNMLPVKQLAETVSKIAAVKTSSSAFTHQQNIMVNIQSFPNALNQQMGVQPQTIPPSYNYPGMHQMPNNYQGFRMPHSNPPPPPYPNQYQMGSQQPYPSSTYSPYMQPGPHNMYNQPLNTPNPNYPTTPYQQNYLSQPSVQYPQTTMNPQIQPGQPHQNPQIPQSTQIPNIIPLPNSTDSMSVNLQSSPTETGKTVAGGIKIQSIQTVNTSVLKSVMHSPKIVGGKDIRGRGARIVRGASIRPGMRPTLRPGLQVGQSIRGGMRPGLTRGIKRPSPSNGTIGSPKKRMEMLLPDRHDNEDCQVVSLQQQRDGLPLIQSIQGSRDKTPSGVQLSSQLTVTKTKVRLPSPPPSTKDANAVANMLASRGIKITQKSKTPPPSINIPNLGSNISVTPAKTSLSNFSLPENDYSCTLCNKSFSSNSSLTMHMSQMHPSQKFRCDACPISYPSAIQLQEHKLAFHNTINSEMGVPVIDLSQPGTLRKLSNLGITNFIPLANREQGGGCFGIPIVSTQNALSGNTTNSLLSLGANGILSFGPVKPLPKC